MAQFSYAGRQVIKITLVGWLSFVSATNLAAQNVGIGNTNPAHKLDLSGRMRIRGGINDNFTAGLWLTGVNNDSTNNKLFIGMESDSSAGFYSELSTYGWFLVANGKEGRLGIRNRNPQYPLSFNDQSGDKLSLFREANGNYYGMGIGNSTLQLMTAGAHAHILFGYGKSGSFTENMRLTGTGDLIIGATAANQAPLTVNKKTGATHALFGSNTTGMAIESNFPGIGFNSYYNGSRKTISTGYSGYIGVNPISGGMQLLVSSQSNNTDVAGTYNTALDIKADGKVGIGVSDPAYKLDIAERMRIRSAPGGFTAGLWLNNTANNASPAFLGMQADDQVGLYGTGTGWGLLMNTQTGALSFGGNAGQPGQVLTSNGSGAAPTWQNGGGNNVFVARQTSSLSLSSGQSDVPGLVANFTLTAPAKVLFHYGGSLFSAICFGCADKRVYLFLLQNVSGATTEISRAVEHVPVQEEITIVAAPEVLDLPAGTYSFKVIMSTSGGNSASLNVARLTWQIFPQ